MLIFTSKLTRKLHLKIYRLLTLANYPNSEKQTPTIGRINTKNGDSAFLKLKRQIRMKTKYYRNSKTLTIFSMIMIN